jgi:hypothetical protein
MPQFGGKDSKRHFTVVMEGKEHGLYVSSTPSSAARKAVTKLCAANKSKKVQFEIREITQGSKKKTYGPYEGHIEKLKEPIELKGRVIKYKPVAKLSGKSGAKKGGMRGGEFVRYHLIPKKRTYRPSISNPYIQYNIYLLKPFLSTDENIAQIQYSFISSLWNYLYNIHEKFYERPEYDQLSDDDITKLVNIFNEELYHHTKSNLEEYKKKQPSGKYFQ